MVTIRIVEATGTGPTPLAAFDSALASVGAENYNLVDLSSVIPVDAELVERDDLAALGSVGDRLHVVRANALTKPGQGGAAGIAWARTDDGEGIFIEASACGQGAKKQVMQELSVTIEHGLSLRSWSAASTDRCLVSVPDTLDQHGCALVLAAYGNPDQPWSNHFSPGTA